MVYRRLNLIGLTSVGDLLVFGRDTAYTLHNPHTIALIFLHNLKGAHDVLFPFAVSVTVYRPGWTHGPRGSFQVFWYTADIGQE